MAQFGIIMRSIERVDGVGAANDDLVDLIRRRFIERPIL